MEGIIHDESHMNFWLSGGVTGYFPGFLLPPFLPARREVQALETMRAWVIAKTLALQNLLNSKLRVYSHRSLVIFTECRSPAYSNWKCCDSLEPFIGLVNRTSFSNCQTKVVRSFLLTSSRALPKVHSLQYDFLYHVTALLLFWMYNVATRNIGTSIMMPVVRELHSGTGFTEFSELNVWQVIMKVIWTEDRL